VSVTIDDLERQLDNEPPQAILAWAIARFRPRIVLACSFGGPSGMAVLDMVMEIDRTTPVFYLDTGLLFPETYALIERVRNRYGMVPIAVKSPLTVEQQSAEYGEALWSRDPDRCCQLRKVEPQREFLKSYDAWISSIRRDQSTTRSDTRVVHFDPIFGVMKVNPLAHWDERMVWAYIHAHNLDYNQLHDANYASIGCIPCTRPIEPGESLRAGRWSTTGKTECGLHAITERIEQ
jgi:phosphoadenosine phosphosulfate reductase